MKKLDTSTTRSGLALRWVPVTTDDGRVAHGDALDRPADAAHRACR